MNKNFFKISLLIASLAIVFSACSKDDDKPQVDTPNNGKSTAVFNPTIAYGTMTDIEGNTYKTVTIGTQTWMAENLRTTKYNDGTIIPHVKGAEWGRATTGAYCNYNNTENKDTIVTFGRLYNWNTVNTGKLAPAGWHVPTDAEWTILTDYLGGLILAGGKLKENGMTHWSDPNLDATNVSGFTALPGGSRDHNGIFFHIGKHGLWWSATEKDAANAWYRYSSYNSSIVTRNDYLKQLGYSVRCIKD